jgi:hypothetical protein
VVFQPREHICELDTRWSLENRDSHQKLACSRHLELSRRLWLPAASTRNIHHRDPGQVFHRLPLMKSGCEGHSGRLARGFLGGFSTRKSAESEGLRRCPLACRRGEYLSNPAPESRFGAPGAFLGAESGSGVMLQSSSSSSPHPGRLEVRAEVMSAIVGHGAEREAVKKGGGRHPSARWSSSLNTGSLTLLSFLQASVSIEASEAALPRRRMGKRPRPIEEGTHTTELAAHHCCPASAWARSLPPLLGCCTHVRGGALCMRTAPLAAFSARLSRLRPPSLGVETVETAINGQAVERTLHGDASCASADGTPFTVALAVVALAMISSVPARRTTRNHARKPLHYRKDARTCRFMEI